MATQRTAHIVESTELNPETKLLTCSMANQELLNFVGGQYVIINTNIPLPGNKIAKRAYSILSRDQDQTHFNIAVKKLGTGPGSNYMHHTHVGSELIFSGPWGQYIPDEFSELNSSMVIATDTGITAALGLVQGNRFKNQIKHASLLWLVVADNYFIPEPYVRDLIKDINVDLEIHHIPPADDTQRLGAAMAHFKAKLKIDLFDSVFLSGDGALLYPFKEECKAHGLEESKIKIECFFNNPFKKVGST